MGERRSPRIAPGSRAEIGLINAALARGAGLATRGQPPRIFTTLGRHRRLFRRWLWFAGALMPGGKLPRGETELVILRVAHNTGADYEWSQHERMARRVGLSDEQISRVRIGADAPGWSERQALLLRAADEMHERRQIDDDLWGQLSRHLDEVLLIELCMLIGHYEMLAMTLNTIGVEPERPVRL
ncbi:MAG: carboxymuconolactone decarboxylase family protein [Solirubrobacterales bacterium]